MIAAGVLREHYGEDEFAAFDDVHLDRALCRAQATAGRYLPPIPPDCESAQRAVREVLLTLARAYAHDEQAFDKAHPVRRELDEALSWLQRVADGRINVLAGCSAAQTATSPLRHGMAVGAPCAAFTADVLRRMS